MNVLPKDKDLRGWLKRKSGRMKIWSRRWFVLTDRFLFWFLHDDDKKREDCIFLDSQIIIQPPKDPSDPRLVYFDIVTGDGKSPHETLSLCAESEEEKNVWVRALKRVLYAEKGGALFSQSLEEILYWEHKAGRHIPYIVDECVEYLYKYGLDMEGIFRLPGRQTVAKDIIARFERGQKVRFEDEGIDVHVVASVLKTFLRSLPDSIIPCRLFQTFMNIGLKYSSGKDAASMELLVLELIDAVKLIPKDNYTILKYVCRFLREVALHEPTNKMSMMSIGTVFSYNILRHIDTENNQLFLMTADLGQNLVFMLLKYYSRVFAHDMRYIDDGENNNVNDNLLRMSRIIDVAVLLPDGLDSPSADRKVFDVNARPAVNDSTIDSSELIRSDGCLLLAEPCGGDSVSNGCVDNAGVMAVPLTGIGDEKTANLISITHSEINDVTELVSVSDVTEHGSVNDDVTEHNSVSDVIEHVSVNNVTDHISVNDVTEHVNISDVREQLSFNFIEEHIEATGITADVEVASVKENKVATFTENVEATSVEENVVVISITENVEATSVEENVVVISITENVESASYTENAEVTFVREHAEAATVIEPAEVVEMRQHASSASSFLTEDFNTASLSPRHSKARISRSKILSGRRRPQTIKWESDDGMPQAVHSPGGINSEDVLNALALMNSPIQTASNNTFPICGNSASEDVDSSVTPEIKLEFVSIPKTELDPDYHSLDLMNEITALREEISQLKIHQRTQIASLKEQLRSLKENYENRIETAQAEYRSRVKELENKLSEEKRSCTAAIADTVRLEETVNKYKMLYGDLP